MTRDVAPHLPSPVCIRPTYDMKLVKGVQTLLIAVLAAVPQTRAATFSDVKKEMKEAGWCVTGTIKVRFVDKVGQPLVGMPVGIWEGTSKGGRTSNDGTYSERITLDLAQHETEKWITVLVGLGWKAELRETGRAIKPSVDQVKIKTGKSPTLFGRWAVLDLRTVPEGQTSKDDAVVLNLEHIEDAARLAEIKEANRKADEERKRGEVEAEHRRIQEEARERYLSAHLEEELVQKARLLVRDGSALRRAEADLRSRTPSHELQRKTDELQGRAMLIAPLATEVSELMSRYERERGGAALRDLLIKHDLLMGLESIKR